MAGYVGTTAQWKHVEADWAALVAKAGVRHIHAVDLFRRTKQFRGWKPEDVNALVLSLDGVIARYLQLGFSVIVRDDDYQNIYGAGPHPKRPRQQGLYELLFHLANLHVEPTEVRPLRREREAAEAMKANPNKSSRAIAEELGIGRRTVDRAREARWVM
jgi:hypothetical protein